MCSQSYSIAPIVVAEEKHLPDVKHLADRHKKELGFINRETLRKAIATQSLLVAPIEYNSNNSVIAGLLHFYQRRDHIVTLYSIVVEDTYRNLGIGKSLFGELIRIAQIHDKTCIRLKCPIELSSNFFYKKLGLELVEMEQGKQRQLNVWTYEVSK